MARGKYKKRREHRTQQQVPIQSLGFSTRLQNLLEANGIVSLADLMDKSDFELLSIKGIGNSALAEIQEKKASMRTTCFHFNGERKLVQESKTKVSYSIE